MKEADDSVIVSPPALDKIVMAGITPNKSRERRRKGGALSNLKKRLEGDSDEEMKPVSKSSVHFMAYTPRVTGVNMKSVNMSNRHLVKRPQQILSVPSEPPSMIKKWDLKGYGWEKQEDGKFRLCKSKK